MMHIDPKLNKHFSMASDVVDITKTLNSFGIVGFFYMRMYPDGSIINLSSQADFSAFYFDQLFSGKYQSKDVSDQLFTQPGVSLWELNAHNQIWQDAKNFFGYGNGLTVCEKNEHFQELSAFYSTADNHSINHFYINQLDVLKHFKNYFVAQASQLINELEKNKCLLPDFIVEQNIKQALEYSSVSAPDELLRQLITSNPSDNTRKNQVYIVHKKTHLPIHLPVQRSQCLRYIVQGKTTKEIARIMSLSPRTVDYYLQLLRKELGSRSSKDLIASYRDQICD